MKQYAAAPASNKSQPAFEEEQFLSLRSKPFGVQQVDLEKVLSFRKLHYDRPDWITDRWDSGATHYGYFREDALQAVLRVVSPLEGKLPVCDHFPNFVLQPGDIQAGRILVAPAARHTRLVYFLWTHATQEIFPVAQRVIVTPRVSISISRAHFENAGFALVACGFPTQQGLERNLFVRSNR